MLASSFILCTGGQIRIGCLLSIFTMSSDSLAFKNTVEVDAIKLPLFCHGNSTEPFLSYWLNWDLIYDDLFGSIPFCKYNAVFPGIWTSLCCACFHFLCGDLGVDAYWFQEISTFEIIEWVQ